MSETIRKRALEELKANKAVINLNLTEYMQTDSKARKVANGSWSVIQLIEAITDDDPYDVAQINDNTYAVQNRKIRLHPLMMVAPNALKEFFDHADLIKQSVPEISETLDRTLKEVADSNCKGCSKKNKAMAVLTEFTGIDLRNHDLEKLKPVLGKLFIETLQDSGPQKVLGRKPPVPRPTPPATQRPAVDDVKRPATPVEDRNRRPKPPQVGAPPAQKQPSFSPDPDAPEPPASFMKAKKLEGAEFIENELVITGGPAPDMPLVPPPPDFTPQLDTRPVDVNRIKSILDSDNKSVRAPREPCIDCARKHIAQAIILLGEAELGYPKHRWLAIGHLAEASEETVGRWPALANELRVERLAMMGDLQYVPMLETFFDRIDEIAD